jgi:hypothetical protein
MIWGTADGVAPSKDMDRVLNLHKFTGKAGFNFIAEVALETVPALTAIAVGSWPSDLSPGTASAATHWADIQVEVLPSPDSNEVVKHSARRVAICCLAEMANYEEYASVIVERCPGFLRELPGILNALLRQYKWRQSYPCMYCPVDYSQWQLIAERMVAIVYGMVNSLMKTKEHSWPSSLRGLLWPCIEVILAAAVVEFAPPDSGSEQETGEAVAANVADTRLELGITHLRDVIFDRTLCKRKLGWGDHMAHSVSCVLHIAMTGPETQSWLRSRGAVDLLVNLNKPTCRLACDEASPPFMPNHIRTAVLQALGCANPPPVHVVSKPGARVCSQCPKPAASKCARCKLVWYCGRGCQLAHWKAGHKSSCGK